MTKRSKFSGTKNAQASLKSLNSALTAPVNEALRKALRPTLAAAKRNLKANSSVRSGGLLKAMTVKKDPDAPKDKPTYLVGPDAKSPAAREAHLVEFGVAPHFQPELDRMHPGHAAAPFLRPAFDETRDEVVKRFGDTIGPAIEKRAAKLARKAK